MAYQIISNKKNTSFVIHISSPSGYTGSAANVIIAGNNSVSNVAIIDEDLTGAYICQAAWGMDPTNSGHIIVKRGANVVAVYDSTSYLDYAGNGMALTKDSAADLNVEFRNSGNGYLMLELQKIGTLPSEYNVT